MLYNSVSAPVDRSGVLIAKSKRLNVRLKELSNNGVALISEKNAAIGTRLEVIFEIPALGYFHTLNLVGIVQHSHMSEEGYYLGLEFEDLSPHNKRLIDDFIDYKQRLHILGKKHYKDYKGA